MKYKERIDLLSKTLLKKGIYHYLINDPADLFYLSGFYEHDALGLFDTEEQLLFVFCDPRLTKIAQEKIQYGEVIEYTGDIYKKIEEYIEGSIWISHNTSLEVHKALQKYFNVIDIERSPLSIQRALKDEDEINLIKEACAITDNVFQYILPYIKEGITEKQIAWEIEKAHKEYGADSLSFPCIIAFGENSACPHHISSEKKLKKNTPILIDMGCSYYNYSSDMTRMIWFGDRVDKEFKKDYEDLLQAQIYSCNNFKEVVTGKEIDTLCRNHLKKNKLDTYFIHSLGHSIGIEVHDGESLSRRSDKKIQPGFVATIEPGIYKEGKYGIRIEDTVAIHPKTKKLEILTKTSKKLHIIG